MDMPIISGRYGKSKVSVFRIFKSPYASSKWRNILDCEVEVILEGNFEECYTQGDNSRIVPTDTIKNICYIVARNSEATTIEDYAVALANFFLQTYSHIMGVNVSVEETLWQRLPVQGKPHVHTFTQNGLEKRTSVCVIYRDGAVTLSSGIKNLRILKATQSGFEGFWTDEYTTLKPADDRVFCTDITASWMYGNRTSEMDFKKIVKQIRQILLQTLAGPPHQGEYSKSVQETLYKMSNAVLAECPYVEAITMSLPNIHHFEYNIERFNLVNNNEILFRSEKPAGLIECTVRRGPRSRL